MEYKNRYGDIFTFTPSEDGHILWEGNFKWCRFGMPNDYNDAFLKFCTDNPGKYTLEEFKEKVHEYDDELKEWKLKDYVSLVKSRKDIINMVDPSGGPYLAEGMKSSSIHPDIKDKVVERFEPIKTGYKIMLK